MNSPAATAERHAYANSVRRVHPSIEPMFERLGGLCSLPAIAEKVIQVAEDELSDATDLLTVIEQDAAVATRLMQVVNSSYCGLRNPVGDLKTAVTMLGQDRVRNLALTVSIGGQFQRATPLGQLDPARLWDHSVCVATIARIAASRSNACNPDEAYLAGLLHDLGLLFITQQLAPLVPRVLARLATGSSLCDAEREVMAFDHAQLGAYVAWRAGFPDHQVAAIDYHHTTYEASPAAQPLTQTVAVANYLATRYGRGAIEGRRLPAPGEGMLRTLGFTLPQLRDLWDDLPDTVAEVAALTGI
ncbi:HDOD domain-containing protein [Botrimarina hoheduenensis]|uniref:HDOD domain-containing protein n=1 Tax=Botrimarina hoheduenensis TaxID=2528000 RepID=UPI0018D34257|nr:HDOD domain-containing protein [Botrimarina hoheduenensis]